MKILHNILSREILPNEFIRISVENKHLPLMVPGKSVIINQQFPCYVMGQDLKKFDLLLSPLVSKNLIPYHLAPVEISPFSTEELPKPDPSAFHCIILEDDALGAGIFYLKKYRAHFKGIIFIGATSCFPFHPCPSRRIIQGLPPHLIAGLPLFEDWNINHRLALEKAELPGCFTGSAQDLASIWLNAVNIPHLITIKINRLSRPN